MENKHQGFDIIKNGTGNILIVIYENNYEKDNVYFKILKDKKHFEIIYKNNKKIIFNNVSVNIINLLLRKKQLLVAEVGLPDTEKEGEIVFNYKMKTLHS